MNNKGIVLLGVTAHPDDEVLIPGLLIKQEIRV
jgi:hypothetical protein